MSVNYDPTMKTYSGQGAFRFWCQKVLPLVYDDSLSYYELLNKVVDYLNNTISDVSNMEDNVSALLTAYEQLQDYVNDYFDNLDVQTEINNKLDEMASDGTFNELFDSVIEGTTASTVQAWLHDNISEVDETVLLDRSLTLDTAAAPADLVGDLKSALGTLSNLNTDDKSSAVAAINEVNNRFLAPVADAVSDWLDDHPEATTTVQDGSLTESKFTNELKLKTIKDYVTPQMFGAVANGTTDDTAAIQSAINACATNGGIVFFPAGKYVITAIEVKKGVNLCGVATHSTTLSTGSILYCTDTQNYAVTLKSDNDISNLAFYYPNLTWDSSNSRPSTQYPATIYIGNNCQRCHIHDITLLNSYQGIKMAYANGPTTIERVIGYCVYNFMDMDGVYDVCRVNDCQIIYTIAWDIYGATVREYFGEWTRNNGIVYRIGDSAWSIINSCFAYAYYKGVEFFQSATGRYDGYNTIFNTCNFDSCGIPVHAPYGINNVFSECIFSTGYSNFPNPAKPDYGIVVDGGDGVVFDSCVFTGFHKGVFDISSDYASISNCLFRSWNLDYDSNNPTNIIKISAGKVINITGNYFIGYYNKGSLYAANYTGLMIKVSDNVFNDIGSTLYAGDTPRFKTSGNIYRGMDANIGRIDYYLSPNVLNSSNPVTIPSGMLEQNVLLIGLRRQAFYGSVTIATKTIKDGSATNGIIISSGMTDGTYWRITISATGEINSVGQTASIDPYVEISAIC